MKYSPNTPKVMLAADTALATATTYLLVANESRGRADEAKLHLRIVVEFLLLTRITYTTSEGTEVGADAYQTLIDFESA